MLDWNNGRGLHRLHVVLCPAAAWMSGESFTPQTSLDSDGLGDGSSVLYSGLGIRRGASLSSTRNIHMLWTTTEATDRD